MRKIYDIKLLSKMILLIIVVLGAVLRFINLNSYPALNADEAAIGYNAYSLIKTGKDEHGNPWPIHFQSFNDYKPGLYFYVVLPFVKVFGLTEMAVRFPGALAGVLTIFAIYFLVKELFPDKEELALFASLLLAISPWHIHFSRGGWEVNFATFLVTAGAVFFLKSINRNLNFISLLVSVVFFAASFYTYHSVRIVVPILLLGITLVYQKVILNNWKKFAMAALVGLVVCLPLFFDLAKPAISSRAQGVGIFADSGPRSRVEEQRIEHGDYGNIFTKLIHNKVVNYGLAILQNWTEHYWGEFLFLSGDEIQRNKVPETGQLYLFELITVLFGLYVIFRSKERGWLVVLCWLVVAPTAAALTFQSPHALRAQNMVIPITIVSALGLNRIAEFIAAKKFRYVAYLGIFALVVWSLGRYIHMYHIHMAKEYPYSSQYGVKELIGFVQEKENDYEKILITDRYDQPYILFLFYLKYPPDSFQAEHRLTGRDKFGFSTVPQFGKYRFSSVNFDEARPENPNTLIVGTDEEIPDEANVVKNVYGVNEFLYFQAVAN